jgi:hypothetical protein
MKTFFFIFPFLYSISAFGQVTAKMDRVIIKYNSQIEDYALALGRILQVGINEAESANFKFAKKIELNINESDRAIVRDNGASIISIEYDTISRFIPPKCIYFICGELERLGILSFMHVFKVKGLKKMTWMNQKFRGCWSIYFAGSMVDNIYDITSDKIWPTPYNFKEFGAENLNRVSNDEKSPIYHELNAWIDLGNHIGFNQFSTFFTHFKKSGCTEDAFLKTLYKFMRSDEAEQWVDKYMQYVTL